MPDYVVSTLSQGQPETLVTQYGTVIKNPDTIKAYKNLAILHDALGLVVELWPKPGYASVTLETHQWVMLRRVLLAIPDLVAADE
jgi:hypothetical protein